MKFLGCKLGALGELVAGWLGCASTIQLQSHRSKLRILLGCRSQRGFEDLCASGQGSLTLGAIHMMKMKMMMLVRVNEVAGDNSSSDNNNNVIINILTYEHHIGLDIGHS